MIETVGIKKKTAVDTAVQSILEKIRNGEFVGGQRLIEADLADEFGLRRGPIREALRVLTGDGVVELVPNKGARVKRLDSGDLVEILQLVTALNWMSLRICAANYENAETRSAVEFAWKRLEEASQQHEEASWYIAIGKYHEALYDASGNALLRREYERLRHVHFHRELTRSLRVDDWDSYIGTYRKLTQLVLDGEAIAKHGDKLVGLITSGEMPACF